MAATKKTEQTAADSGAVRLITGAESSPRRSLARSLSHEMAPLVGAMSAEYAVSAGAGTSRRRVPNPNLYPFSAVVALHCFTSSGALRGGTAFLAGPRLLITAAHNLYTRAHGTTTAVRVFPGLNDRIGPRTPNILISNDASGRLLQVYPGWTDNVEGDDNECFDLGAIFLPDDLSSRGIIQALKLTDADLKGLSVNALGYPALGPSNDRYLSYMYLEYGQIDHPSGWRIFYDIPTQQGLSGAPVILYRSKQPRETQYTAVGVHTWGEKSSWNFGTRINVEIGEQIAAWLEESEPA